MSPFKYEFPRPGLTVDVVALCGDADEGQILLIRRGIAPFRGQWALPGGFVNEDEPPEAAARRELAEETGVSPRQEFELIGVYGDPGRDPRGWTVAAAYLVRLEHEECSAEGGDDAEAAAWYPVPGLPRLAFDHDRIVRDALARVG